MATLVKADGTRTEIPVPTLEEAQKLIGGWVEVVHPKFTREVFFLCDEEGLLKDLPINAHGCALYGTVLHGHPIAGDIIVIERKEPGAKKWTR
jgi:hypothetical protein